MGTMTPDARIKEVTAQVYKIPTDAPEADGTLSWSSTTLVLAQVGAGGQRGIGYTYADGACAKLIGGKLADALTGHSAVDIPARWGSMVRAMRNDGRPGLASCAISAVDTALWDLKGKLQELPVCRLLGMAHPDVPIYGSGGFTTYTDDELREQLAGWVEQDGCAWVKMKVGMHPEQDPDRVAVARDAIGEHGLFVDGNGAYTTKQALELADI
ncbi:enolase C-terminal domain-like protein, partial [Mycobacterium sp.]|uniref:enolase C-terminal domain-like protein n=1 Tax=Mycobacterium sp. TaxID=1785 RepID=UPI003F816514